MNSLPLMKKQVLILLVFSALVSIAAIIHGLFFNLDFVQIRQLTFEGFLLTFLVIFPAVLFLEWVFDLNNKEKFDKLERKIKKLKK
jgi:hypothetical protein